MKNEKNEMNVQAFFDTLGKLYGEKHNLKVTYTVRKKTEEELKRDQENKEDK